jgi:tetrahydromethanopterin S-methyltransferase subunit B
METETFENEGGACLGLVVGLIIAIPIWALIIFAVFLLRGCL